MYTKDELLTFLKKIPIAELTAMLEEMQQQLQTSVDRLKDGFSESVDVEELEIEEDLPLPIDIAWKKEGF